jgi:hypothetical protein
LEDKPQAIGDRHRLKRGNDRRRILSAQKVSQIAVQERKRCSQLVVRRPNGYGVASVSQCDADKRTEGECVSQLPPAQLGAVEGLQVDRSKRLDGKNGRKIQRIPRQVQMDEPWEDPEAVVTVEVVVGGGQEAKVDE